MAEDGKGHGGQGGSETTGKDGGSTGEGLGEGEGGEEGTGEVHVAGFHNRILMHKLACECSAAALRCRLSQASSLLGGMSMLIYLGFCFYCMCHCISLFYVLCVVFFTMQLCVSTNKFYNDNYNWLRTERDTAARAAQRLQTKMVVYWGGTGGGGGRTREGSERRGLRTRRLERGRGWEGS